MTFFPKIKPESNLYVNIRINTEDNITPETSTMFSVCGDEELKLFEFFFDKLLAA
jgi:hypothetical protein